MAIYINTDKLKEQHIGASKVKEIYLGTSKVYSSELYLIKGGVKQVTWTAVGKAYDDLEGTYGYYTPVESAQSGYLQVSLSGRSGSHPGGIFYCDLPTGYNTLHFRFTGMVYRNLDFGITDLNKTNYISSSWAQWSSIDVAQMYSEDVSVVTEIGIAVDDLAAATNSHKVCVALCSGSSTNYATTVNLYDVWLE